MLRLGLCSKRQYNWDYRVTLSSIKIGLITLNNVIQYFHFSTCTLLQVAEKTLHKPIQLLTWNMLKLLIHPYTSKQSVVHVFSLKNSHIHTGSWQSKGLFFCTFESIERFSLTIDSQWIPFVLFKDDSSTRLDSNHTTTGAFRLLSSFTNLQDDAKWLSLAPFKDTTYVFDSDHNMKSFPLHCNITFDRRNHTNNCPFNSNQVPSPYFIAILSWCIVAHTELCKNSIV
jgi:hypothetical protein